MTRMILMLLFGVWLYLALFGGWAETIGLAVVIVLLDVNTRG